MLVSCKCKEQLQNTTAIDSVYVKQELRPVVLPTDSASIVALFECDSLNRVLLRQIDGQSTKNLSATYTFSDGLFSYYVWRPTDTIWVRETVTLRAKTKPVYINVPVAKMNTFQRIFFWIGVSLSILTIVYVIIKIYKFLN